MQHTREQLLARSSDRHLSVTAGAGAGKTTVLVQRFIHLLLDKGVDVRDITAITFTRKAASEMASRVTRAIEERLADAALQSQWERLKNIREKLNNARISTIHSFCSRLLREYPIEAGVNPNFSEMEEYEVVRMKEQAIIRVLEDCLESDTGNTTQSELENDVETFYADIRPKLIAHDRVRAVWQMFGKRRIQEVLLNLLNNAELFRELQHLYQTQPDEEFLARRDAQLLPFFHGKLWNYTELFLEGIRCVNIQDLSKTSKSRTILEEELINLTGLYHRLQTISESWETLEIHVQALMQSKKTLCTAEGRISGKVVRENYVSNPDLYRTINERLEAAFTPLEGLDEIVSNENFDTALLSHARTLVDICTLALEEVEKEKQRLALLDFDDLQLLTDRLLDNETVCASIRRHIRYLMVDEFQDTNELQYRLTKKLVGIWYTADTKPDLAPVSKTDAITCNFFIVGDPKQSIYRFRGADVRVFARVKEDIAAHNTYLLVQNRLQEYFVLENKRYNASEHELTGAINLAATFRLSPVVAAFVNRVCGKLMHPKTTDRWSEFDVEYKNIVCGLSGPAMLEGSISLVISKKDTSQPADNESEPKAEQESLTEPELLARYLRHIVEQKPVLVRGNDGNERPAQYADIFILSRSRTGQDELVSALRSQEIPYMVHSGRGYFERQEILDMRNFLLFLHNTADDIACATVLRSPFFFIGDEELYRISRAGSGSFWDRVQRYMTGDTIHSADMVRAYGTLLSLLPLAARLSIPTLLHTIIQRTGWRGIITAHERFEQIEANMEKLFEFARVYEQRGFRNVFDFASELTTLAEYGSKEGEAEIVQSKNAVTLMTIHASKGLEAPIVVLYRSNANTRQNRRIFTDNAYGVNFELQHQDENGILSPLRTPLFILAKLREDDASFAEEKRLLYVALTRARDHVVISGEIAVNKEGKVGKMVGFLPLILEGIEHSTDVITTADIIQCSDMLTLIDNNTLSERAVDYKLNIIRDIKFEDVITSDAPILQPNTWNLPDVLLEIPEISVEGDFYSASQLRLFHENPDEYRQTYHLGLMLAEEGTLESIARDTLDDRDAVRGSVAGTMIHRVLEQLPLWLSADGIVHSEIFERIVDYIMPEGNQLIQKQMRERIKQETLNVARTALIQRCAQGFSTSQREYELTMPIGVDFLHGVFDMIVQNERGDYEIWDWKTHHVETHDAMEQIFGAHNLQLDVYAYLLSHLYPEQETFRARLLFTRRAAHDIADAEWTRSSVYSREDLRFIGQNIQRLIHEIRKSRYGQIL